MIFLEKLHFYFCEKQLLVPVGETMLLNLLLSQNVVSLIQDE